MFIGAHHLLINREFVISSINAFLQSDTLSNALILRKSGLITTNPSSTLQDSIARYANATEISPPSSKQSKTRRRFCIAKSLTVAADTRFITLFRMLINTANTSPEPISEHTPRFQQPQILPVAGGQKDVLERLWALTVTLTKKARFARILGLL